MKTRYGRVCSSTQLGIALLFMTTMCPVVLGQTEIKTLDQNELVYILEPTVDGENIRFRVDLYFKENESGTSKLRLPLEWDGQEQLYNQIKNLRAASANAQIADTAEPHIKSITYSPNEMVHVQYDVVQDWSGGDVKNGLFNRAILQKDYFYFIGNTFWVYPDWEKTKRVSVRLYWKNIPKGWVLAHSFGTNTVKQTIKTSLYDFVKGVYLGGDFRIKALPIKGVSINIATRGNWKFTDEEFNATLEKIWKQEIALWNDKHFPYFLVILFPTEERKSVTSGEARTNAFAVYVSKDRPDVSFGLKSTLTHELFHTWAPSRLGVRPKSDAESEKLRWFTEGFADYYAHLLLLRGGLITLDDYVGEYNSQLRAYYTSPKRDLSNEQILAQKQSDSDAERQWYLRGYLLAHNWNAQIRSATKGRHSLDDVMRDLLQKARKKAAVLSARTINDAVRRYAKESVQEDIQRHIEEGALIHPRNDVLGTCLEMYRGKLGTTILPQFRVKAGAV